MLNQDQISTNPLRVTIINSINQNIKEKIWVQMGMNSTEICLVYQLKIYYSKSNRLNQRISSKSDLYKVNRIVIKVDLTH